MSPPLAYLDHAATSPLRPEVVEAMAPYATGRYGNASGSHQVARRARLALEDARDEVAALLGAQAREVVFTSGGTEAANLAVLGVLGARVAAGRPAGTVVHSAVEHAAVLECCRAAARGAAALPAGVPPLERRVVPVDATGTVDVGALAALLGAAGSRGLGAAGSRGLGAAGSRGLGAAGSRGLGAAGSRELGAAGSRELGAAGSRELGAAGSRGLGAAGSRGLGAAGSRGLGAAGSRGLGAEGSRGLGAEGSRGLGAEVSLVSVMLANNEVGTVQPLAAVAEQVRRHAPGAVLHTDAVQAAATMDLAVAAAAADLVSVSAHKLGGPPGSGALVVREGVALAPMLFGGGQERERRSGTHDVAGAVGLAAALRACAIGRGAEVARLAQLRDRLADGLGGSIEGLTESVPRHLVLPGHCHVRVAGVEREELLVLLDRGGVCAAAGAACASGALEPSHVLTAMGVPDADARGALRFTLGHSTTRHEIDQAVAVTAAAVATLRGVDPPATAGPVVAARPVEPVTTR